MDVTGAFCQIVGVISGWSACYLPGSEDVFLSMILGWSIQEPHPARITSVLLATIMTLSLAILVFGMVFPFFFQRTITIGSSTKKPNICQRVRLNISLFWQRCTYRLQCVPVNPSLFC